MSSCVIGSFLRFAGCLLAACAAVLVSAPAAAQSAVCCNIIVPVDGKWTGMSRDCAGGLAQASPEARAKSCMALSKAGVVCQDSQPYCKGCDKEALEKARADYQRWLKTYNELRANADFLGAEASGVARDGEKIWGDYFVGLGIKQIRKMAMKNLPESVKTGVRVYSAKDTPEAAIKEGAGLLKDLSKIVKGGAWKNAAPVVDVADMLLNLGIVNAKMLTLLGEFDRYAKEAKKAADAALDALKKARAAKERIDALEAQCKAAQQAGRPPAKSGRGEDDEFKSTGERELDAAVKLRDSWQKVDGGYVDTHGNIYSGNAALQEALAIVRSQPTGAAEQPFRRVSFTPDEARGWSMLAQSSTAEKDIRAGNLMAAGFDRIALGLEAYLRVVAEVERIVQMRASGSPKPAPRGAPR